MRQETRRNFAKAGIVMYVVAFTMLFSGLYYGFQYSREHGHLPQLNLSPFR